MFQRTGRQPRRLSNSGILDPRKTKLKTQIEEFIKTGAHKQYTILVLRLLQVYSHGEL
jgi:hypothetical protein